jgi:hypothetical protein
MEIKDVIDLRRVGTHNKTFYLARTIDGVYYWFPTRRTFHDRRLQKSIRACRRKIQAEANRKKKHGTRKLRYGRNVRA